MCRDFAINNHLPSPFLQTLLHHLFLKTIQTPQTHMSAPLHYNLQSILKHLKLLFKLIIQHFLYFILSPQKTDFMSYRTAQRNTMIQTAQGLTRTLGYGTVEWRLVSEDGSLFPIQVPCQHVPAAKMRLLSPQELC